MGGGDSSELSFNDDRKRVIRQALDHGWDQPSSMELRPTFFSILNERTEPAQLVKDALWRHFKENWSIVVYDTWESEAGFGTYFLYDNKYYVYGVSSHYRRHSVWVDKETIQRFMEREFGRTKIADIDQFACEVRRRMNSAFEGIWRVHVVKFKPESYNDWVVIGAHWTHDDGYSCFIMRLV
jgi:hypothetical protein